MDANFTNSLHVLIAKIFSTQDTVELKAITAQLQDFYKDHRCIPGLFQIMVSATATEQRQFAAVELRKRIGWRSGQLWLENSQALRDEMKLRILDYTLQEQDQKVRHSAARVIQAIASIELENKTWPTLLPWLYQCATSANAGAREVGVYVIYAMTELGSEEFLDHIPHLLTLFSRTIQDPESLEVRIATVKALGVLAQSIEASETQYIATLHSLFPSIISILQEVVLAGNEDAARDGFDVLETILVVEAPIIGKHLPDLVNFLLTAVSKTNHAVEIDDDIRVLALNALIWTIKYRKNKLQQLELPKVILETVMPIGCEADPDLEEEDTPSRLCFRVIDSLATTFPPKLVFPTLHAMVQQYMASPDPEFRKCAMVSFGVAIEGCSEYIRPHMTRLWPLLDAGLVDQHWLVRKSACIALACTCEYLGDETAERHAVFLPAILNLVNDPQTRTAACQALDSYLETLGDPVVIYLDQLMTQMLTLLDSGDQKAQSVVLGAIGSAAHAAHERFMPYLGMVMHRLQPLLFATEEDQHDTRALANDAAGTIAEAVGKEAFEPYFQPLMTQAVAGIALKSSRLTESGFLLFVSLSRVFPVEIAPYLEHIVPLLVASCTAKDDGSDDDDKVKDTPILMGNGTAEAPLVISDLEDDVGDSEFQERLEEMLKEEIKVNSALTIEKEIAVDAVGSLFVATKAAFLPYVEVCLEALIKCLEHYFEGVRRAAVESLCEFVRTFYEISGYEWVPLKQVAPVHDNVARIWNIVVPNILNMTKEDDDKEVIGAVCKCLAELIIAYGPTAMGDRYEQMATLAEEILRKAHLCQQDRDDEENENTPENIVDEQAEFDTELTNAAMDLVGSFAHILGPEFGQQFNRFLPLLCQYAAKGGPADRAAALGTLGEITCALKEGVTPFTETLFATMYNALSDTEAEVRINAAYAIGRLIETTTLDSSPLYLQILGALQPYFTLPPDAPATYLHARDNASGAVSRMIIKNINAVPLEQVLPILFSALPLQKDFQENVPVFRCICHVYEFSPAHLHPYFEGVLRLMYHVLQPVPEDQIDEETRGRIITLLRHANGTAAESIAAAGLAPYLTATI